MAYMGIGKSSVSDPEPDLDSGVFWIRMNPDPDPGA